MKRSLLLVAVLATSILTPHAAEARGTALASQYGPPGDPASRTATGLLVTTATRCFADRSMRFHTVVRFWWHGATATAACLDRGPAAWTGCRFDLTSGLVRLLEWRANFRPVYHGWRWHLNPDGSRHKWRHFVGWRRIAHWSWSGRQRLTWARV